PTPRDYQYCAPPMLAIRNMESTPRPHRCVILSIISTTSICLTSPKSGVVAVSSHRGYWISLQRHYTTIRDCRNSLVVYLTPVKVAGRSRPRSMKQCRSRFLPRLYSSVSSHAVKQDLQTNSCRPCGINSVDTWRRQPKRRKS